MGKQLLEHLNTVYSLYFKSNILTYFINYPNYHYSLQIPSFKYLTKLKKTFLSDELQETNLKFLQNRTIQYQTQNKSFREQDLFRISQPNPT